MKLTFIFNREITSEKASVVQMVNMCEAFASAGIDIEVALPIEKSDQKSLSHEYFENRFGIKNRLNLTFWTKRTLFNRLGRLGSYYGIKTLLHRSKADLYFTRCSMTFNLIVNNKLPVIYESHNSKLHNSIELIDRYWSDKMINASQKKYCFAFITISEKLAKYWADKGVPPEKILPLHDGFYHRMFNENINIIQARAELNLPLGKKIITYTGSLYPDREIDNIIRLAEQFPNVIFIVLGGPLANSVQYQSHANKRNVTNIKFLGPIEHSKVPMYLYASDALLALWSKKVPTINYCSPLKIFEYMAAGRIIIAHGFPTIKEVIRHKENGLIVSPDDFSDLIAKTKMALYDNELSSLGVHARVEAFKKYTWDRRVEKILEYVKNLDL